MNAGLVFLHSSHRPQCDAEIDKHFVGYASLQFMMSGMVDLRRVEPEVSRAWSLNGRWFWACYPGPRFAFRAGAGVRSWDHRHVAMSGPVVTEWLAEGLIPTDPQPAPDDVDWAARFDELRALISSPRRYATRCAVNRLEGILLDLADGRSDSSQIRGWLTTVLEALASDLSEPVNYPELAGRVAMGLSTLRRLFREATGSSLHSHRIDCRLAEARRLLSDTDTPINVIARTLGYTDVFAFSTQFRQRNGLPPAQFRQSRLL